jgi:hypothetical protein
MEFGGGKGVGTKAALAAGFKPSYAPIASHRMLRRGIVVAEIEKRQKIRLRTLVPKAVDVVEQILDTEDHKDRLRAANQILNRVDPLLVGVAHQHDVTIRTGDQLGLDMLRRLRELGAPREMIEKMVGHNALPALEERLDSGEEPEPMPESGPVIDGEVLAVESDDGDDPDDE